MTSLLELAKSGKLTVDDIKANPKVTNKKEREKLTKWAYPYASDEVLGQLLSSKSIYAPHIMIARYEKVDPRGFRGHASMSLLKKKKKKSENKEGRFVGGRDVDFPPMSHALRALDNDWLFVMCPDDYLHYDDTELFEKMVSKYARIVDMEKMLNSSKEDGKIENHIVENHLDEVNILLHGEIRPGIPISAYEKALRTGQIKYEHIEKVMKNSLEQVTRFAGKTRNAKNHYVARAMSVWKTWQNLVEKDDDSTLANQKRTHEEEIDTEDEEEEEEEDSARPTKRSRK